MSLSTVAAQPAIVSAPSIYANPFDNGAIEAQADGMDNVAPKHPTDAAYMANYQIGQDLYNQSFDDRY